jgi:hypothetical protein
MISFATLRSNVLPLSLLRLAIESYIGQNREISRQIKLKDVNWFVKFYPLIHEFINGSALLIVAFACYRGMRTTHLQQQRIMALEKLTLHLAKLAVPDMDMKEVNAMLADLEKDMKKN